MRRLGPLLAFAATCALRAGASEAATHVVVVERMAFTPDRLVVRAGDVVEWRNRDVVPHTATAESKTFDVVLAAGEAKRIAVDAASESVAVFCRYHPSMRMALDVALEPQAPSRSSSARLRSMPQR